MHLGQGTVFWEGHVLVVGTVDVSLGSGTVLINAVLMFSRAVFDFAYCSVFVKVLKVRELFHM